MGGGFAHVFGLAGIAVAIGDASAELAKRSRESLLARARAYDDDGLFSVGATAALEGNVRAATSVADAVDVAD